MAITLKKNVNPYNTNSKTDTNRSLMTMVQEDKSIIDTRSRMRDILRDKARQLSNPGLQVMAFEIQQSDWDKATDLFTLMQDFTNMRNGDAFVSSSVDILLNPLVNANIRVYAGRKDEISEPSDIALEAKRYLDWTFDQMYNGIQYYHKHLTLGFYYGFALYEKVWLKGDEFEGKLTNRLAKLSPIQADTIQRFYYDDIQEFIGVRLYKRIPNYGSRWVELMVEDMHRFTPFEEFNNVQGRSIIRPIRFVWNIKQKLLRSSARAVDRGAGIPVITLAPGVTDSSPIASKAQQIIQTIGNSENSGVVDQEGQFKFSMQGLQNQGSAMELINFCNHEIVYNTLTQFLVSGIGGSGSRAATDSHKGSYQGMINTFRKLLEDNYNFLIENIIDNSYLYGKLDHIEYPYISIEIPKDLDLTLVASNWSQLVQNSGVTPTIEDEKYFRETFGLPDLSEEEIKKARETKSNSQKSNPEQFKQEETEDNTVEEKTNELQGGISEDVNQKVETVIKPELSKETKNGKSKKDHGKHPGLEYLDKASNKVQDIVDTHYRMMIDNAIVQLQKDRNKPVVIPQTMRDSMFKAINQAYNDIHKKGYEHGKDMLKKVDSDIKLEKSKGALALSNNGKKLKYIVDLASSSIENQINNNMLNVNDKTIENKGGISKYINDTFAEGGNVIKSNLVNNTVSGYNSGINDSQSDYESETGNELLKMYTVQLERQNICENCFPYEGMIFTKEEAESVGLNWESTPLNPDCLGLLGKNQCQCSWVVEDVNRN